jgi:hypothetical protein
MAYQVYYDRLVTPESFGGSAINVTRYFSALIDRARVWSAPDSQSPGGSVIELVGDDPQEGTAGDPDEPGIGDDADTQIMREADRRLEELFPEAKQERIVRRWFHRTGHDDYFVTTQGSDARRPTAATPVPNLFLAGDYTANSFSVIGMEGAVVSGIEAANHVLRVEGFAPREVLPMNEPGGLVPALRAMLKASGLFRTVVGYQERV